MDQQYSPWRSALPIRAALFAALIGAGAVGGYNYTAQSLNADSAPETTPVTSTPAEASSSPSTTNAPAAPFTTAAAGTCLTWQVGEDGSLKNFERADCEAEHRFEVSSREDLATYPSSEFGTKAARPDITRQAQLREELCQSATLSYLDGRYDPSGRYSIASILPPQDKWDAGDRTLLCGVQETDSSGKVMMTTGFAAHQDQARVYPPGWCLSVDRANQLAPIGCSQDHQLEATAIIKLEEHFGDQPPSIEDQDAHLNDVCHQAAIDYLGGDEALHLTGVQPYWVPVQSASWMGGSRSANCFLVHANGGGGFSTLKNTATAPEEFLIDGTKPADDHADHNH